MRNGSALLWAVQVMEKGSEKAVHRGPRWQYRATCDEIELTARAFRPKEGGKRQDYRHVTGIREKALR